MRRLGGMIFLVWLLALPGARAEEAPRLLEVEPGRSGDQIVCRLHTRGLPEQRQLQTMRSGLESAVEFQLVLLDDQFGANVNFATEHFLLGRLARGLGSRNVDHRLQRRDFSGQAHDPVAPGIGLPLAELDGVSAALVVDSPGRDATFVMLGNTPDEYLAAAHDVEQSAMSHAITIRRPLHYARTIVKAADVQGGQPEFKEIREGPAIYYIGEFKFINEEWRFFEVDFRPEGADQTYTLKFKHQLYIN